MHNDMSGSARKETVCGRTDFGHGKIRMNVEGDRLSSLPDDLIHKILSFISIEDAIGMSVLSSRWRFIWTSMPDLKFKECSTHYSSSFYKFVSNVLSRRNKQIQVSSLNLELRGPVCADSYGRIHNYACTHNVQQLQLTARCYNHYGVLGPLDLPALTTLHLDCIILSDDNPDQCMNLFSKCPNLENLSLRCQVIGTNVLNICHPRLSNITLKDSQRHLEVVNVVAPQLKTLTVINCHGKLQISAPGLTSLVMKSHIPLHLISTQGFPSLEKADLYIHNTVSEYADEIVCLLQHLHNVKFLTLNFGILEIVSSSPILHQLSPFANVKILSFSRKNLDWVYMEVRAHEKATTSTETKNILSESSPSAILVSPKEIIAMREIIYTERYMKHLQDMLKRCEGRDTNKARMESRKRKMLIDEGKAQWAQSPVEIFQSRVGEIIPQIEQRKSENFSCSYPSKDCTLETSYMISQLQDIIGLVSELPASKRDVMQPRLSSLCEEASIFMNEMMDCKMILS